MDDFATLPGGIYIGDDGHNLVNADERDARQLRQPHPDLRG